MRVSVDFDEFYARQEDPWGIGNADAARYELYRGRLLERRRASTAILDVGSGFGAFLARFRDDFESHDAVELTAKGVAEGRRRYPWIDFMQGSADALGLTEADARSYSAIIFSDVIAYLDPTGRTRALDWIAAHLAPDGVALIAAYSPGGRYLTPGELRHLVQVRFAIDEEHLLDTGHMALIVRAKRCLAALTVDYETWQPIPPGREIDWDRDVFRPTDALLGAADRAGGPVTLFAEVGEYLWLSEHEPAVAERMAQQWREAVVRGHDVQLHLHPNWLPELGARRNNGEWSWDWSLRRADDYPGDLTDLIARCKRALEDAIRPVAPDYSVTCFRAGAYEAQPFRRLWDALVENGIRCDSSVYAGGSRDDRTYDYSLAYSRHQPYYASRHDPQLKAPPAEQGVIELPIFAPRRNERWTFDFDTARHFAAELLGWLKNEREATTTAETERRRAHLRAVLGSAYVLLRRAGPALNRVVPRRLAHLMSPYGREALAQDAYFVLVGHTKADLEIDAIGRGIEELQREGVELVTLSAMLASASVALEGTASADPAQEARWQVEREHQAVMADERDEAQSARLQAMIPLDRRNLLDLGCGAGRWTERIAATRPWATVTGIDVGDEFIARAERDHQRENTTFAVADFLDLPLQDGSFDCVYADNTLEHAFDVDATLLEVHRVLSSGGVLVAAIPSDARNPERVCDNHSWKTAPSDVATRLAAAGFVDISLEEVDVFKALGAPPFPPSLDRMMYVRAWKRPGPAGARARAQELARFAYEQLDPQRPHGSGDLTELLAAGSAWCTGYAVATGLLLQREGYEVRWVTMVADGPPASGEAAIDAHDVLEIKLSDGSELVLDPMACVWLEHPLVDLLREPDLADTDRTRDERYRARSYDLYATSHWYRRVVKVAVRADPRDVHDFQLAETIRAKGSLAPPSAWRRTALNYRARARSRIARYRAA